MFVSQAFAQAADAAGQPSLLESVAPFVLILGVFYILLIRPQQKKMTEHRKMLTSIRRGDKVVTAGGLHAEVLRVIGEDVLECEIADGVKVKVERTLVSHLQAKPEPVSRDKGGSGDGDKGPANDKGSKAGEKKKGGLSGLRDLLTGKN